MSKIIKRKKDIDFCFECPKCGELGDFCYEFGVNQKGIYYKYCCSECGEIGTKYNYRNNRIPKQEDVKFDTNNRGDNNYRYALLRPSRPFARVIKRFETAKEVVEEIEKTHNCIDYRIGDYETGDCYLLDGFVESYIYEEVE